MTKRQPAVFDATRIVAAFFVIAIHTSPLLSWNAEADFILTRIIARFAVPLFLMLSGYFLRPDKPGKLLKKTAMLYAGSIILYLPLNLYTSYFSTNGIANIIKDILFNGTLYHLWYLPALLFGVSVTIFLVRRLRLRAAGMVAGFLYIIGLFGDSYYGLIVRLPIAEVVYAYMFQIFEYTRNGLFFAPLFLILGIYAAQKQIASGLKIYAGLSVSFLLLLTEGLILHHYTLQRHDSMYIFLVPFMYFFFIILAHFNQGNSKTKRSLAMMIYILHPWCIVLVRGFAKLTDLQFLLLDDSLVYFLAVSVIAFCLSVFLLLMYNRIKKDAPAADGRAWIEVDTNALYRNAQHLQKCLPEKCRLMAVVKADAYGHSVNITIPALRKAGVRAFAVATLAEGIELRKLHVKDDILILGYTSPQNAPYIQCYNLTQTICSLAYAAELNQQNVNIKAHIKVDTGMHRLGISYADKSEIKAIFQYRNLQITGIYSHLSVSDSLAAENTAFTENQIEGFFRLIRALKNDGIDPGAVHIQSTYGILNYSGLPCDYARAGIGIYGVLSQPGATRKKIELVSALSLKARIADIKNVCAGESVGYGRIFQTTRDTKIAVISIGYADGIPRNWSNGYILIHGQAAPVIGRVCMDQFMVDISEIQNVQPGDIATIIGKDGNAEIRCEDFASQCSTITNDILSRLGPRLPRIEI